MPDISTIGTLDILDRAFALTAFAVSAFNRALIPTEAPLSNKALYNTESSDGPPITGNCDSGYIDAGDTNFGDTVKGDRGVAGVVVVDIESGDIIPDKGLSAGL